MEKTKILIVVVFAALIGFFANSIQTATADVPGGYYECFAATSYLVQGRSLNNQKAPKKTVKIPPGWTVVGGGGVHGGNSVLIVCR